MKKIVSKSMLAPFFALISLSVSLGGNAQAKDTPPRVYAIINKADWCPVCQANGSKVMNEVMPACRNLDIKFLANDLTNEQTIAKSATELKKAKVFNAIKETNATGLILLVDTKTKKIIKQISVAKPAEEIIKEITAAQG
jgi:hypothetical protein